MQIFEYRNTPNAVLIVEIPVSGCGYTLNSIKCGHIEHFLENFDNTMVCYTMFNTIKDKLSGTSIKVAKYKFVSSCCNFINKSFIMSFTTAPNATSLKKIANVVMKTISPNKNYGKYAVACKTMNETPSKEMFGACCKIINEALGKMKISIAGKVNSETVKESFKKVVEVVSPKYDGVFGDRTTPLKNFSHAEGLHKITGYSGVKLFLMKCYFEGMSARIVNCGNTLYVNSSAENKLNMDNDRIVKFLDSLKKAKNYKDIIRHDALVSCFLTQDQAAAAISF